METRGMKQELEAQRVITFLDRKQVDFLDRLGKDALFSTGTKLSRTRIISTMVDVLMHTRLNGEGVHGPEELEQKIADAVKSGFTR